MANSLAGTWELQHVSVSGTNDQAIAHGEFVEIPDDLQKVLKAMRIKGISIESIQNHTVGEHTQFVFIKFWAQGASLELAKALRYVLEVDVGTISAPEARL